MLQLAVEQSAAPKRLDSAAAEIDESSGDGADRPERGLLGGAELTGRIRQPVSGVDGSSANASAGNRILRKAPEKARSG
jgi:hypothetical protein